MNDKVVNFRQGKKRLARSAKEKLAEQNRAKFGRSKAEKTLEGARAQKAKRHIDHHKLDQNTDE